jgi:hypothetical protein
MASQVELVRLNEEIAQREDQVAQDDAATRTFFERLLAPVFAMRRAGGEQRHTDRAGYLGAIKPGPRKTADIEVVFESPQCAVVTCVVRVRTASDTPQNGTNEHWQEFRNVRLFTRPTEQDRWQLLAWANEPLQ